MVITLLNFAGNLFCYWEATDSCFLVTSQPCPITGIGPRFAPYLAHIMRGLQHKNIVKKYGVEIFHGKCSIIKFSPTLLLGTNKIYKELFYHSVYFLLAEQHIIRGEWALPLLCFFYSSQGGNEHYYCIHTAVESFFSLFPQRTDDSKTVHDNGWIMYLTFSHAWCRSEMHIMVSM